MQLKAYNISVLKTDFFSGSDLIHVCYHPITEHNATGYEKDEECGKGATKETSQQSESAANGCAALVGNGAGSP